MSDDVFGTYLDAFHPSAKTGAADPLVDEIAQEEKNRAAAALISAGVSPEQARKSNALARNTGLPPMTVDANYAKVQADQDKHLAVTMLGGSSTVLHNWMTDPRNAAAGADDMGPLSKLSGYSTISARYPIKRLPRKPPTLFGGLWTDFWANIGYVQEGVKLRRADQTLKGTSPEAIFANLTRSPAAVKAKAEKDRDQSLNKIGQYQLAQQRERPVYSTRTLNALYSGLSSLTQQLPGLLASVALRSPIPSLVAAGGSTASQSYTEDRSKGIDPDRAGRAALAKGTIEVATELLPMTKFLGAFGQGTAKGFGKELAKGAAADVIGEQLATFGQDAVDTQTSGEPWSKFWADRPGAAYDTLVATLTQNALMGGGSVVARRAFKSLDDKAGHAVLEGLIEDASMSELGKADPTALAQFLAKVTEGTAIENVYIPGEAIRELLQGNIAEDPFWAPYADQINEAIALGGDVVVPVGEVAASLANRPEWEGLKQHARFLAGGNSPAESKALETDSDTAGQVAELVREALTKAAPVAQVYSDVREQLLDAGYTPDQAHQYATAWAANRAGLAQQTGTDALAYHTANPMTVNRVLPEGLAQAQKGDRLDAVIDALKAPNDTAGATDQPAVEPELKAAADEMRTILTDRGIDPQTATRPQIKQALAAYSKEAANGRGLESERGRSGERGGQALTDAPQIAGEQFGPVDGVVAAAEAYAQAAGIAYARQAEYVEIDPAFAGRLAEAYEAMEHMPDDPAVAEAYADLAAQTRAQYDALIAAGYSFSFGDPDGDYFASGFNALRDLRENQTMQIYPTVAGYGSSDAFDASQNPLLADTGLTWTDHTGAEQPVYFNDLFRAVHDAFGHGIEGAGFRDRGEENAWQAHARLFTGPALAALTSETRGQNSWVNYGPHGEENRDASAADTTYADQKTGLLPEWAWTENRAPDMDRSHEQGTDQFAGQRDRVSGLGGAGWAGSAIEISRPPTDKDGNVTLSHWSQAEGLTETDPERWGQSRTFLSKEERSRIGKAPGRTYFGIGHGQPGGYVGEFGETRTRYVAKVPLARLYDMAADPDGLKDKGRAIEADRLGRREFGGRLLDGASLLERLIEEAGYAGYWIKNSQIGMVAAVFEPVQIETYAEPTARVLNQVIDLNERREGRALAEFAKGMGDRVQELMQQARERINELREAGKLPLNIGDRFTTDKSREQGLLPWTVVGYDASGKEPDRYGYYVERGEPGQDGYERTKMLVSDPKADARMLKHTPDWDRAKNIAQWQVMTGPRSLYQDELQIGVFYSALERTVEAVKSERAPAAQWAATLKNAPGVKAEELELTGVLEWLGEQQGQVAKADVLKLVRENGVELEEKVLGEVDEGELEQAIWDARDAEEESARSSWYGAYVVEEVTEDEEGEPLPEPKWQAKGINGYDDHDELFDTEDEAQEKVWELDDEAFSEAFDTSVDEDEVRKSLGGGTKWSDYSLARGGKEKNSYREWLLILPTGERGNPDDSPSTHWDDDGVVAHARGFDAKGPNGEKILFLDEIQSDWHQQGREEGYDTPADPAVIEKAREAFLAANDAESAALDAEAPVLKEFHKAVLEAARPVREAIIAQFNAQGETEKNMVLVKVSRELDWNALVENAPGYVNATDLRYIWLKVLSAAEKYNVKAEVGKADDGLPIMDVTPEQQRAADLYVELTPLFNAAVEAKRVAKLREDEFHLAEQGGSTPDAPFKSSWPVLMMKRMIHHAATNGYDQIAWIKQGENNGGMNDNVDWFYGKVLPNETGKFIKKYGSKVRPVSVVGRDAMPAGRPAEIRVRMDQLETETSRVAAAAGTKDEVREKWERARRTIEDRIAVRVNRIENEIPAQRLDQPASGGYSQTYFDNLIADLIEENKNDQAILDKTPDFEPLWAAAEEHRALAAEYSEAVRTGPTNLGFDITPDLKEAARAGLPLFQKKGKKPQGRVSGGLVSATDTPHLIELFDGANLSTFIHETGHIWLEELKRNASLPDASDQIKADWETVKAWFADNKAAVNADGFIPTEAHELWARGFERHAMEGRSPSEALRAVFTKFRAWLLTIYKHVDNLNAPITDEIRAVMNRLYATQEAIDEEAVNQNIRLAFDQQTLKMTDAEYAALLKVAGEARDNAYDALIYRTMSAIRASRTKAWKAEEQNVRDEVTARINSLPEFRALHLLRTGKWLGEPDRQGVSVKLDKAWLLATYGEDALGKLPKGVPPIYNEDGGNADQIAELVGISSGSELVAMLMAIETQTQNLRANNDKRSARVAMIEGEVSNTMSERHGDPLNDGSIEEEALAAIHNDTQGEVIASEARALGRQSGKTNTPYRVARQWAAEKIAEGKVTDVASRAALQRYAKAAAKAAKLAGEAGLKGDIDEAFRQKQVQLLNHALLAEAKKAADFVDGAVERLGKIAKRATIKLVNQEHLNRAHDLLEGFSFRPRSQRSIDAQDKFEAWAVEARSEGIDVAVPPRFSSGSHYSRMTVDELRGLDEAVKQQIHLGRRWQKLLDAKDAREFADARNAMMESMAALPQREPDPNVLTIAHRAKKRIAEFHASLLKMERVIDFLDGDNPNGPFNRYILRPLLEAAHASADMQKEHAARDIENVKRLPPEIIKRASEKVSIPQLPASSGDIVWTRSQLWQMAKNFGTADNARVLCEGLGWNEEEAFAALDAALSKEEWDYIQGDLDNVGVFWPQIKAMYERINGLAPPKVEPREIVTRHGTYPGGYYPLVPDSTKNVALEQRINADDLLRAAYTRATTRNGFINERTGATYVVSLNEGISRRHVVEVIHDITHREALMQASRFLSDSRVKTAIRRTAGVEAEKQMEPWLKHIANQWAVDRTGAEGAEWIASKLRTSMSIMGMGFRLSTAMQQVGGYANSINELGTNGEAWMGSGFKSVAGMGPKAALDFALERSGELRNRLVQVDATQEAELRKLEGKDGLGALSRRFAFHLIGYMDRAVVLPTWHAAYNKAQGDGMSEAESIQFADKIIRNSQGAAGAINSAAIQRQRGWGSLFVMFYSYGSAYYNQQAKLMGDIKRAKAEDVPRLMARTFWLMLAPNLISTGIQAALGQGPDDDEDWASWLLMNLIAGSFAGVPYARELVSSMTRGFDYSASPLDRMGVTLLRAGSDLWHIVDLDDQTEPSKRAVKNATEAIGYSAALPLGQFSNAAQFIVDWSNDKVDPEGVGDWMRGLQTGKGPQ